jgi:hypothetical protein
MLSPEQPAEATQQQVHKQQVADVPGLQQPRDKDAAVLLEPKTQQQERAEAVGEIPEPSAGPSAAAGTETEREALCDIKVPETLILDRKVLLRPDRCPCTLCRWFLYEVSQAVERVGTTSLESQADMLRDSCPLLALAMSKDHRVREFGVVFWVADGFVFLVCDPLGYWIPAIYG